MFVRPRLFFFSPFFASLMFVYHAFMILQVLWKVGAEEGQAKYGNAYVDVWTIDKFHQVGSSKRRVRIVTMYSSGDLA